MDSGKILLGVLAGAAVGALLGVLLAPEKGSDTRKKIAKMSEGYSDGIKEKLDNFLGSLTEKFEQVKEEVCDLSEKAQTKKEEIKTANS